MPQGLTDQQLNDLSKSAPTPGGGMTDEQLNALSGTSHGASGSWEQSWRDQLPSMVHPIVANTLEPLARFGKAGLEGAYGVAHMPVDIYNAATTPAQTENEKTAAHYGYLPLATQRLLVQPTIDNAKEFLKHMTKEDPKYLEATIDAVGMVPGIGPVAKDLINQARSGDIAGVAGKAAGMAAAGSIAHEAAGSIPKGSEFVTEPKSIVTKALNPADDRFQAYLDKGMDEVKAAEANSGNKFTKVEDWQRGLNNRTTKYNQDISKMVDPQSHIEVPGSRAEIIKAQVDAIPADTPPAQRAKLRQDILNRYPKDLTIGQLNNLRSELSATQSSFYGKDLSGQLTMDAGTRAIDIARGQAVRNMFYDALDKYGLGKGQEIRELNSRIGAIIHMQDALGSKVNNAVGQRTGIVGQISNAVKGKTTIDQDLTTALNRWKTQARPVNTDVTNMVGTGTDTSYVKGVQPTPVEAAGHMPKQIPARGQTGSPYAIPPTETSEVSGVNAPKVTPTPRGPGGKYKIQYKGELPPPPKR